MQKRLIALMTMVMVAAFAASAFAATAEDILQKNTCLSCHSLDGSRKIGPTLKGLYGKEVTLSDGSTVTADEAYLAESITEPKAKIVKGYNPMMPPNKLTDEEVTTVVDYLKTLK